MMNLTLPHISTGVVAVVAGAIALLAAKGGGAHVFAGRAFVVTMTVSSLIGAALGLAAADDFLITAFAGVLAAYLVVSGWSAAYFRHDRPSGMTISLALLNALNAGLLIFIGSVAMRDDGVYRGFAAEDYFFLAAMAIVGVLGDAAVLLRQTISDNQRIARHLWRMCLGFFIAAGSAFTGPGQEAFPEAIRETGILSLPELLIFLAFLIYLFRVLIWPRRP
ncbi:MAG: hypothetical protein AAGH38_06290 [Pseudomonadota bacterium]